MKNPRQSILDEMKRCGWSRYRLVRALNGKRPGGKDVPASTVYQFLNGTSKIGYTDLGLIFNALGLELKRNGR